MKLLIPVDGSPASMNAVKKSVEIAEKYGFSIKMITVIDEDMISRHNRSEKLWRQVDGSIISGRERNIDKEDISGNLRENALELLDTVTEKIAFGEIKPEKEVLYGEPHEKILETAKEEGFDLIVMGYRGHSKIKHFFTDSVTQKVISEASCPVLVIRTDTED